ncbi:lytic transglycosylase domain-containing protein, partial [Mesorhizobium sp. M7A.T.Ca.US.000.02.1.1]|uniref:lytic transglycosylase domain-containing protein n=1 Tax=Mesorhizobium sp. M7A.T.Ca.US.000.02.1.1 TaxID=2496792 RepID=UPI0013E2BD8A
MSLLVLAALAQPATAKLQDSTTSIPANILELIGTCAPDVHPNTMWKILGHESGFTPFIIGVNEKGKERQVFRLKSQQEAAQKARELIAQGKSIDMGLGQIWSGNLKGLKLTPEEVFEPCTNVAAAAGLLMEAYERAVKQGFTDRQAMDQALSVYNTGKFDN